MPRMSTMRTEELEAKREEYRVRLRRELPLAERRQLQDGFQSITRELNKRGQG